MSDSREEIIILIIMLFMNKKMFKKESQACFFLTMTITINNGFIMFGSWNAKYKMDFYKCIFHELHVKIHKIFLRDLFTYHVYTVLSCTQQFRHPSACGSNGTRAVTADGQGFPGKWVTSEIFWLLRLESQPGKLHAHSLPHGWDWWGNWGCHLDGYLI